MSFRVWYKKSIIFIDFVRLDQHFVNAIQTIMSFHDFSRIYNEIENTQNVDKEFMTLITWDLIELWNESSVAVSDGGLDACHRCHCLALSVVVVVCRSSQSLQSSVINEFLVEIAVGEDLHLTLAPEQ